MKKLYMIGDSIRMGYAPYVKIALAGKADCFWPPENCCFAAYTYYSLGDWEAQLRIGQDCDVVHWNVGLHDMIRFTGDEPVSTPECYGNYLGRIIGRIKFLYPNAVQVFATNTPVIESKHSFWLYRKEADVEIYNDVARKVMRENGIAVNELHNVITPECYSDKCHFYNPIGRKITTEAVLKAVIPYLGISMDEVSVPDYSDEAAARMAKLEDVRA